MTNYSGVSGNQLRQYIERIERLEEEKVNLLTDIREVFGEAKSNGFDPKIMRQVLKIRKMNHDDRLEQEEVLNVYLHALGLMAGQSDDKDNVAPDVTAAS